MKKWLQLATVFTILSAAAAAPAQHQHGGHGTGHAAPGMKMDQQEVIVEGVKVLFQFMTNAEHRKMLAAMKSKETPAPGTTHNVAVVLSDAASGRTLADAQVKMKVIDPQNREQVKALRYAPAMRAYDNYFNLPESGRYQVVIAFKIGDGPVKNAGVYYELK